MKLLMIIGLLWVVCHWHGVAEVKALPVDVVQLATMAGGHVSVTGVVTAAKLRGDGSSLITIESAQRPVVCYAGPLIGVGLPPLGSSVLVTGKVIGAGMLGLDPDGLVLTKALVRDGGIRVVHCWVGGKTANGLRTHVSYQTMDGDIHPDGLVSGDLVNHLKDARVLYGHWEASVYLIDGKGV